MLETRAPRSPALPLAAAILTASALLVLPPDARAFHSAMLFPDDASVGGAGGLYYNGSPRHKRYTCAACHIDAPGLASLELTSQPAGLVDDGVYEPGRVYAITVSLVGETRGLGVPHDYNTFSVEVIDSAHEPAGAFESYAAGGMVTTIPRDALFARYRDDIVATEWHFEWRAPEAGAGTLELYMAGVDGDGAGSTDESLTNPLGDDVMVTYLKMEEAGQPAADEGVDSGCGAGRAPLGPEIALIVLLLLSAALARRRTPRHHRAER